MACTLTGDDYCLRHRTRHVGRLKEISQMEDGRGYRYRRLWDERLGLEPEPVPGGGTLCVEFTPFGLGDHLLMSLVVAGLRDKYPKRKIVFQVHPNGRPWVDLLDLGVQVGSLGEPVPGATDWFQPYNNYGREVAERSRQERWRYYADLCGGDITPRVPDLRLPPEALTWAERWRGCTVLAPRSFWSNRNWSLSHWLLLEERLKRAGRTVVVLDADRERLAPFRSEKIAGYAPAHVLALMKVAAAAVCLDSGAGHMAALCGTPSTTVLCGPSSGPKIFNVYGPHVRCLGGSAGCGGCYWSGPHYTADCERMCADLQTITADQVMSELGRRSLV